MVENVRWIIPHKGSHFQIRNAAWLVSEERKCEPEENLTWSQQHFKTNKSTENIETTFFSFAPDIFDLQASRIGKLLTPYKMPLDDKYNNCQKKNMIDPTNISGKFQYV